MEYEKLPNIKVFKMKRYFFLLLDTRFENYSDCLLLNCLQMMCKHDLELVENYLILFTGHNLLK